MNGHLNGHCDYGMEPTDYARYITYINAYVNLECFDKSDLAFNLLLIIKTYTLIFKVSIPNMF